jgi:hypothetical protein
MGPSDEKAMTLIMSIGIELLLSRRSQESIHV